MMQQPRSRHLKRKKSWLELQDHLSSLREEDESRRKSTSPQLQIPHSEGEGEYKQLKFVAGTHSANYGTILWCGYWADNLDEALQPPLCEKCWEKPMVQTRIKRVDPNGLAHGIKKE